MKNTHYEDVVEENESHEHDQNDHHATGISAAAYKSGMIMMRTVL